MDIKKICREECKGCAIISGCDFPVSLNGRKCPCTTCIVKVMCPISTACEEYLSYQEYLISTLGEKFREV